MASDIVDLILALLTTIGTAVFYGLLRFAKERTKKKESFEPRMLLRTAMWAAVVGLALWLMGLAVTPETFLQGEGILASAGGGMVAVYIDQILNALWPVTKKGPPASG